MDELVRLHPDFDPARHFPLTTAAAGEEILTQGAAPDGMILLLSGLLRAEFVPPGGEPRLVATIRPGTLVGEIGLYAGVPRTARVVAEAPCELLRLDGRALDDLAATAPPSPRPAPPRRRHPRPPPDAHHGAPPRRRRLRRAGRPLGRRDPAPRSRHRYCACGPIKPSSKRAPPSPSASLLGSTARARLHCSLASSVRGNYRARPSAEPKRNALRPH